MNTCNYIYNKTIEVINNGASISFYSLRDMLVTNMTKKTDPRYVELSNEIKQLRKDKNDEKLLNAKLKEFSLLKKDIVATKNININDWELRTPKEIRAGSVHDVCKAYNTAFANLKAGNIFGFSMGFRKHNDDKSIVIQQNLINIKNGIISIAPTFTDNQCCFLMGKKTIRKHRHISINHDVRLQRKFGEYWLVIPIEVERKMRKLPETCCGIDPGVRSFMTVFNDKSNVKEIKYRSILLKKLNSKLASIKYTSNKRQRIRKKAYLKIEKRKDSIITDLHWKTIITLLSDNDVLFYGDIKSHDIVKNRKNRFLNQRMNDLMFYQFRQRLLYKADVYGKLVILVPEHNTTKTCSYCGTIKEMGDKRVYNCDACGIVIGRDINSGRNMLIKGITM